MQWVDVDPSDRSPSSASAGRTSSPCSRRPAARSSRDSMAIVAWLERQVPEPALWPAAPARRAGGRRLRRVVQPRLEGARRTRSPPSASGSCPTRAKLDAWSAALAGWLPWFEALLDGRDFLLGRDARRRRHLRLPVPEVRRPGPGARRRGPVPRRPRRAPSRHRGGLPAARGLGAAARRAAAGPSAAPAAAMSSVPRRRGTGRTTRPSPSAPRATHREVLSGVTGSFMRPSCACFNLRLSQGHTEREYRALTGVSTDRPAPPAGRSHVVHRSVSGSLGNRGSNL